MCSCFIITLSAQKHDNIWLFGYDSDANVEVAGGTVIDFSISPLGIYKENRDMDLDITNASICDSEGQLLFYTNGIYIANANHELMGNGDNLNPGEYAGDHPDGYRVDQGAIVLPQPNHDSIYYLFHEAIDYPIEDISFHGTHFYYSTIDITQNDGLGAVIEKNQILVQDTLVLGKITATKHANGRDWWILILEYGTNLYYRFLLTPDGVEIQEPQAIGENIPIGIGQAVFSPDGNTYIHCNISGTLNNSKNRFHIYDFDRCTGLLSNPQLIEFNPDGFNPLAVGVAVSSNSRYAYWSMTRMVMQLDLYADDIEASLDTVAVYDGFTDIFSTTFFMAQLAPDDKIYINCTNTVRYLHVIHNPDEAGTACNFEQHGVMLPTYNLFSLPNFPNYRLGALEGSPCDTIVSNTSTIIPETNSFKLYPNPTQHQVQIELSTTFPKNVPIEIMDVYGKVLGRDVLLAHQKELRLSLRDLVAGIYFIRIKAPNGIILSQKLMIHR